MVAESSPIQSESNQKISWKISILIERIPILI